MLRLANARTRTRPLLARARPLCEPAPPPAPAVQDYYQRRTPVEHVLLRPGMYVGSTDPERTRAWLFDGRRRRMARRDVDMVPGLFKIFDEILVNAVDNLQRSGSSMTGVEVEIDAKAGVIRVRNDGKGIPVEIHPSEGVYVPELVLGNLFTGSNFNDEEARLTAGRHGHGAKLTNIFSTAFTVRTADARQGLQYEQTWTANMSQRSEPRVEPWRGRARDEFTEVEFAPDLARFGREALTRDDVRVMERRLYDVAACNAGLAVSLNGKALPVRSFPNFCALFLEKDHPVPLLHHRLNKRWEVAVSASPTSQFAHVSFVNSTATTRGGTHVTALTEQLCAALAAAANRAQQDVKVTPAQVRSHLSLFVNCQIDRPAFDSQTKECLTTKPADFGSRHALPKAFLDRVAAESGVVERVVEWAREKQRARLARAGGQGARRKRAGALAIPKLDDANLAGGAKADECTLILTEGDSAKALAVAGLAVVGRDRFGVFPLRGKPLNVRDASLAAIAKNAEIASLCAILGLQMGKPPPAHGLRYGSVMVMTDQDVDGSHIKGLLVNLFHRFWPSLLEEPGFLRQFVTPLLKASRAGHPPQAFFDRHAFERWMAALAPEERARWRVRYYKGLGTSSAAEAREYFGDLDRHVIDFCYDAARDDARIELAFAKANAEARKQWLRRPPGAGTTAVPASGEPVPLADFIDSDLHEFSLESVARSIPSAVDGLKPSQRKILFGCFKRSLVRDEIKVAQLAGYVAEHTGYHHGEASLLATITKMAQDFVGASNLPLLVPSGQFGTRLAGGKDAASARYIFTALSPLARLVFPEADDAGLHFLEEDGQPVEPRHYVPILPLLLVNGAEGIGTGWSTSVPAYNPLDIIDRLLGRRTETPLRPWYRGFEGSIEPASRGRWITTGVAARDGNVVTVSELPVGQWTADAKERLVDMQGRGLVKRVRENHSERHVHFEVTLSKAGAAELDAPGAPALEDWLRLRTTLHTANMHAFSHAGELQSFATAEEVLDAFVPVRRAAYEDRRARLLAQLAAEVDAVVRKGAFVRAVVDGSLEVFGAPEADVEAAVEALGLDADFLRMPLRQLTAEHLLRLQAKEEALRGQLAELEGTSADDMWRRELEELRAALDGGGVGGSA